MPARIRFGLRAAFLVVAATCAWNGAAAAPKNVPAGEPVTVPLRFLAHLAIVDVTINGKGPFEMIVDTGAGVTVLDRSLADELEIPALAQTEIGSPMADAPSAVDSFAVDTLEIGGVIFHGLGAVAVDLQSMFKGMTAPRGVLGVTSLRGRLVTLDYPGRQLRLQTGELPAADGVLVFEFDETEGVTIVPVSVGGVKIDATLDTGAPGGLSLPMEYAARLPLAGEPRRSGGGHTIDASFETVSAELDGDLTIGQFVLPHPIIDFGERIRRPNIGAGILQRFAVTVDATHHRLRLEPSGEFPGRVASENLGAPRREVQRGNGGTKRYGIRFMGGIDGESLTVNGIEEGLAADAAGLRAGDRIVAINGTPIAEMSREGRMSALRASPLRVTVERDGAEIEITMSLD